MDYPDEQALIDYITQNRDGFVNVAQSSGTRDQPYQLEASTEQYSSGQPPHGTQSVVFKIFQDVGGAHPLDLVQGVQLQPRDAASRSPSTPCSDPGSDAAGR